jgi:hypothetical protein
MAGNACISAFFKKNRPAAPGFHRIFTAPPYKGIVTKGNEPKEVKKMRKTSLLTAAALSIPFVLVANSQSFAASHPFEFHADATMVHERFGPVDDAYGYMNVITDGEGKGTINVMFSNASDLDRAQFNARVKFLNAKGTIVQEEHFDCWIDAEGLREAGECKVSQPLTVRGFDSVEVDFYLSDIPELSAALAAY